MPLDNLSTLSNAAGERPTLLKAVRATATTTDRDETVTEIGDVITSAAKIVRDAGALGLGTPTSVIVTEHGCVAQLDTDGVLAWSVLFVTHRPRITTPPDSPGYMVITGRIEGHLWQLNNGASVMPGGGAA